MSRKDIKYFKKSVPVDKMFAEALQKTRLSDTITLVSDASILVHDVAAEVSGESEADVDLAIQNLKKLHNNLLFKSTFIEKEKVEIFTQRYEVELELHASRHRSEYFFSEESKIVTMSNNMENQRAVQYKIARFLKYLKIDEPTPLTEKQQAEMKRYYEIGAQLQEAEEIEYFEHLIKSIQTNQSPFTCEGKWYVNTYDMLFEASANFKPFIFVCASSGTGKTQLPFTVQCPSLYFLYSKTPKKPEDPNIKHELQQTIYSCFTKPSEILRRELRHDFSEHHKEYFSGGELKFEQFKGSSKLRTLGFLIYTIQQVFERKLKNPSSNWLTLEVDLFTSTYAVYKPLTINEANEELGKLKDKYSYKFPIIFFDECQKSRTTTKFIEKYRFIRSLLRNIGLICIFMGTNAGLSNFVNLNTAGDSRSGEPRPWCYVFHRLPKISDCYLKNETEKCQKLLDNISDENNRSKLEEFIAQFKNVLRNERPLFCMFCFDYIKKMLATPLQHSFDPLSNVLQIVQQIFRMFKDRKSLFKKYTVEDYNAYNYANLSLQSPEFWSKSTYACESEDMERNARCEATEAIHKHIAYLYISKKLSTMLPGFPFLGISVGTSEFPIIGQYTEKHESGVLRDPETLYLQRQQIFAAFKDETIGESAFSGPSNLDNRFLAPQSRLRNNAEIAPAYKRVSTISIIKKIIRGGYNIKFNIVSKSEAWTFLEISASFSALTASHYKGFTGMSFQSWLYFFVRELDKNAEFNEEKSQEIICSDDKYWKSFTDIPIPFCGSSINSDWNEGFAEYLGTVGGDLGVVNADLGLNSRDFFIRRLPSSKGDAIPISGECKYRKDGLTIPLLRATIKRLQGFSSPINIIVTNKIIKRICQGEINDSHFHGLKPFHMYYICSKSTEAYTMKRIYSSKTDVEITKCFVLIEI